MEGMGGGGEMKGLCVRIEAGWDGKGSIHPKPNGISLGRVGRDGRMLDICCVWKTEKNAKCPIFK